MRCLPNEVLRAVAATGGFIGVTCVPRFLGRTADIRAMLDHIDYAVKTLGVEHVAIGTDQVFTSRNWDAQRKKIQTRPRSRDYFGDLWPADQAYAPETDEERAAFSRPDLQAKSMYWTNWPLYTVGLVQRGYGDDDIRKLIGGNVLRVLASVIPWNG